MFSVQIGANKKLDTSVSTRLISEIIAKVEKVKRPANYREHAAAGCLYALNLL